jgi:DNA-binding NarL/FixJ family response regulator
MGAMMKLLLVDDSDLIRHRLIELLAPMPGLSLVATASLLQEAQSLVEQHQPDILVLDLILPDGHAAGLIPNLRALSPRTRIAVLTNDISEIARCRCLQGGVEWFFDKSTEFEALLSAIHQVMAERPKDLVS